MPGVRMYQAERRFVTFDLLCKVGTALPADWMRPSRSARSIGRSRSNYKVIRPKASRNSQASITCRIPIESRGRGSEPFACFRVDLNCDPITALSPRLNLRKKLYGLPFGRDGFDQAFIEVALRQRFLVHLRSRRPSTRINSKKWPSEVWSIN